MFIGDGLAYLPIRCLNYEYMESFPKVLLTPSVEWKQYYFGDDGQWYHSDENISIWSNVSATSSAQFTDLLESIFSSLHYKPPTITFADDVAFTKGATDENYFMTYPS